MNSTWSDSLSFYGDITRRGDSLTHPLEVGGHIRPIARLVNAVKMFDHSSQFLAVAVAPAQALDIGFGGSNGQYPAGFAFGNQVWPSAIQCAQNRQCTCLGLTKHHRKAVLQGRSKEKVRPTVNFREF